MILVHEGVGDGQQLGLVAAILGQRESGDAADVGDVAAGQQVVQNLVLRAQHAAGLNVDDHGTAAQFFNLLLESAGDSAHDGAFEGVDLCISQGDGLLGQRRGAAQQHDQNQCDAKQLFHWGIPPFYFRAYCAIYTYI